MDSVMGDMRLTPSCGSEPPPSLTELTYDPMAAATPSEIQGSQSPSPAATISSDIFSTACRNGTTSTGAIPRDSSTSRIER